jgi:CRISPR-associated protein (TIGR03986 family)
MRPTKPANRAEMPKHSDTIVERLSYAPYNFVPLPDAVMPASEGRRHPAGGDPGSGAEADASPRPWETHDRYVPGTFTGFFDLTITAATSLYVRAAPPADQAEPEEPRANRQRQHFFHLGDPEKPALPGSSLRGMTRSLLEVVAFARMSPGQHFSDRRLIYRAVGDTTSLGVGYRNLVLGPNQARGARLGFDYPSPRLQAGYLRRRGPDWFIQPARTINGETFVHVEYAAAPCPPHDPNRDYHPKADIVYVFLRPPAARTTPPRSNANLVLNLAVVSDPADVVKSQRGAEPPEGFVRAKIVRSGHMTGQSEKHMHCAIYEPAGDAPPLPIDRRMWEAYEDDRDMPRGYHTRPLGRDGDPLFYLLDEAGQVIFFGPTMMFRLPYRDSLAAFVPEHVRESNGLDLAEAIFGTVRGKTAVKGRVFFEDAPWDGLGGVPFLQPGDAGRRTPYVLGSPKPTAFQHYLSQPVVDLPGGQREPSAKDRRTLCTFHQPLGQGPFTMTDHQGQPLAVTDGTVLRGHKRYWHQPKATDKFRFHQALAREDEQQLTIIRPVRPGTVFKGRLRFENLTEVELGALLTVLQLKPSQRHHLGMGKPLGMGSVRIEPTLRLTDRIARYASLFGDDSRVSTGDVSAADVEKVAARCRQLFEGAVRTHYRNTAVNPVTSLTDLWAIPRLRSLAAMLEWDNAPLLERTGYAPPGVAEDDLKWWRERRVLPSPEFVAGLVELLPEPRRAVPSAPPPVRDRDGDRGRGRGRDRDQPRGREREPARPPAPRYEPGKSVLCVLLDEKTKAGNWKAQIKDSDIKGDVVGSAPGEAEVGKEVTLVVRFFTPPGNASFWWPEAVPKPKTKGRGVS